MKTEEIALSRVSENEANPREISQANFQKLVQSIIVFPRMLPADERDSEGNIVYKYNGAKF